MQGVLRPSDPLFDDGPRLVDAAEGSEPNGTTQPRLVQGRRGRGSTLQVFQNPLVPDSLRCELHRNRGEKERRAGGGLVALFQREEAGCRGGGVSRGCARDQRHTAGEGSLTQGGFVSVLSAQVGAKLGDGDVPVHRRQEGRIRRERLTQQLGLALSVQQRGTVFRGQPQAPRQHRITGAGRRAKHGKQKEWKG